MNSHQLGSLSFPFARPRLQCLAGLAVCAALIVGGVAHAAPPAGEAGAPHAFEQKIAEHVSGHLDGLAARLEIKASQESVWQAFRAAFTEYMTPPAGEHKSKDKTDTDAASLARHFADRAADRAQRLAKVADATARLQAVLLPEQRLVLDEAAHRFLHHDSGHGEFGEWAGHHGGPQSCEGHGPPPPHGEYHGAQPGSPQMGGWAPN